MQVFTLQGSVGVSWRYGAFCSYNKKLSKSIYIRQVVKTDALMPLLCDMTTLKASSVLRATSNCLISYILNILKGICWIFPRRIGWCIVPRGWDPAEWVERSSLMVRAPDSQCRCHNCPGFDPSILRSSGIWGAANPYKSLKKQTVPCVSSFFAPISEFLCMRISPTGPYLILPDKIFESCLNGGPEDGEYFLV